ncbi:MAG: Kae1-associated serine/threonine protein kinase [Hadesarchaea archaeon]|nr:Kae1-associated serine/threonine protein kinase [Hadesarchaea archaeon]
MEIIQQGAEANLILKDFSETLDLNEKGKVLLKHRIPKSYRVKALDDYLRESRTVLEAKLLSDSKRAEVPTPIVYEIDRKEMKIIMEHVDGKRVKTFLNEMSKSKRKKLCEKIGEYIAKLHKFGIIHGDLTTSNMIRTEQEKIYFIDFGLGEYDDSIEARGTDLHLLWRTLQSTHHEVSEESFEAILNGYKNEFGKGADEIIQRVKEIKLRGRYVPKEER